MEIFVRNSIHLSSSIFVKNVCIGTKICNKRFIMTSRLKLEKVLEDLKKNPYFDKYAEKIAKFQKTSPEEFLRCVKNQEKNQHKKKVAVYLTRSCTQSLWSFAFLKTKILSPWGHTRKNNFSNHAVENTYITTPIFYVNAGPHIGHLYTAVFADSIARFNSMLGCSVFLCTGTDEYGTKVRNAANAENLPIFEYCTKVSNKFQNMCDLFQVEYSQFIRTTEKRHQEAVYNFWDCLDKGGHIYLGKYSGWYSVSDETFISDIELMEKTKKVEDIKLVSELKNSMEWIEEDTYKFKLASFQDDLKYWLKDENRIQPAKYRKVLSNWIEEGLQDLSISRPISRVPWAIPTPSDKSHTVYVWLDALVNYLTAVGYPNSSFRQFWPPTIQVVGKDILKFHGIYWPAFLIAAGLEPPKKLLCHGHWTIDDIKMSKSRGNVISPFVAMNDFTQDGLRYYLLRRAVLHSDANYNNQKVQEILNAELANTLGNLINRCFSESLNPKKIIPDPSAYMNILKSDIALANIKALETISKRTRVFYESYNLHNVVDAVMSMLHNANQMFTYYQPWCLKESKDLDSVKQINAVIGLALENVRVAALILHPIIPRLTSTLLDSLQISKANRTWEDTKPLHVTNSLNGVERVASQNKLLFKKIKI